MTAHSFQTPAQLRRQSSGISVGPAEGLQEDRASPEPLSPNLESQASSPEDDNRLSLQQPQLWKWPYPARGPEMEIRQGPEENFRDHTAFMTQSTEY